MGLFEKEKEAIAFIKKAEKLALEMSDKGFHVAFSGGKDSQVLLALMQEAGVRYHTEMLITSVDPPQLMKFVRKFYPEVRKVLPKINMYKLIMNYKMLPTRKARFCCKVLKESTGAGTVTCVGVRKSESAQRAKRNKVEIYGKKGEVFDLNNYGELISETEELPLFGIEKKTKVECVGGKDKIIISPIFEWSDTDVWQFIKENNMPYCELYNMGFSRVGCLCCPLSSAKNRKKQRILFPRMVDKIYLRAIKALREQGYYKEFASDEDTLEWWLDDKTSKEFLNEKKENTLYNEQKCNDGNGKC